MCSISCEFFLNYLIDLYIFLCVRSRPRSTVAVVSESVPLICGAAEVKCYETEILIGGKRRSMSELYLFSGINVRSFSD